MARGLIGHPLKDDIFMVRDDFGGPGAPMPYVMGWYWGSALPLSNTISPWIFRVQKKESIQNDVKLNIIVYVNLLLCCS